MGALVVVPECHHACAGRYVDTDGWNAVLPSGSGAVAPCASAEYTGEAPHWVEHEHRGLAPEAFTSGGAVVDYEVGGTIEDLSEGCTPYRCGDDVVGRGPFAFHAHLPHGAAAYGKQLRLPEVESVGTACVEAQRAVVGMVEHVGVQVIVVPFKPVLEIGFYGFPRDIGIVSLEDIAVEGP